MLKLKRVCTLLLSLTIVTLLLLSIGCEDTGNTGDDTTEEDITPPGDVSNLEATEGDGQITITWDNPSDNDIDKIEISYLSNKGINNSSGERNINKRPSSAIKNKVKSS